MKLGDQWEKITITLSANYAEIAGEFIISLTGRGILTDNLSYADTEIPTDIKVSGQDIVRITTWLLRGEIEQGMLEEIETRLSRLQTNAGSPRAPAIKIARDPETDEDWAEKWKEFFKPVRAGSRFIIRPRWENASTGRDDIEIIIDPGQAFGVGTHASTALMLSSMEWLWQIEGGKGYSPSVLDVGTGTGILAIAACMLGASGVTALDIDPEALRAARENARLNGVLNRVQVSSIPVDALGRDFDLVLANIDRDTIALLRDHLVKAVKGGGVLMISGILSTTVREVTQMLESKGLETLRAVTGSGAGDSGSDEWACAVMRLTQKDSA